MLFISFLLIGCAWAAMLALPFTILTNALSGGHMGTYLGLFNGTICIPQIIAAALGGSILSLFTPKGVLPPEINMLVLAGVMLIIGAFCVYLIKVSSVCYIIFFNPLPSPFTIFVLTFLFYFRILRIFTAITTENTSP